MLEKLRDVTHKGFNQWLKENYIEKKYTLEELGLWAKKIWNLNVG